MSGRSVRSTADSQPPEIILIEGTSTDTDLQQTSSDSTEVNNNDATGRVYTASVKTGSQRAGSRYTSERGEDEMYPMTSLNFKQKDVKNRFKGVVGPLSLFAPYPHEEVGISVDDDMMEGKTVKVVDERIEMERPVTPIDEEIKVQPLHFTQLAKYIRRRLAAKPEIEYLSIDEQQSLAGILMGEVNGIWPDIRRQIDDPFLSPEDNKELNRRIAVHIVTVCEQLFKHYIDKAQILNKRGVFSGPANMSRLKAQLALDANKFLNVLMIRRYIVSDIRGKNESESNMGSDKDFIYAKKPPVPKPETEGLSYKALIQQSRPKSKTKKYRFRTVEEDLEEMAKEMPVLDTGKLAAIVQQLPTPRAESVEEVRLSGNDKMTDSESSITDGTTGHPSYIATFLNEDTVIMHHKYHDISHLGNKYCIVVDKKHVPTANNTRRTSILNAFLGIEYDSMQNILLKRSKSLPELQHETLADEIDLVVPPKENREIIEGVDVYTLDIKRKKAPKKKDLGDRSYIANDLRKLTERHQTDTHGDDVDDDLPPLIQAILTSTKHDGRKAQLDRQLKQLEKKEQEEEAKKQIPLQRPTHAQPATVPAKMPNKMVVRASDIRVSERVCMSSMTIQQTAPVYNDLLDDITPNEVKHLDSNLFLGSEVTEVYEEIMKTVPTDHLDLEVDTLIEPSAKTVNLASAIASTTLLNSKKKNRIVNKDIQKKGDAPWTGEDLRDWARTAFPPEIDPFAKIFFRESKASFNTNINILKNFYRDVSPHSPVKDMRGGVSVNPLTPNDGNIAGAAGGKFIPGVGNLDDLPPMVAERMSRSYNSWLQWWKNTVNYDDYLKYLSNKETDYLAAVFHFYNSDDENEEDERSPSVIEKMKQEEEAAIQKEKKLEELCTQKAEFTPGMWNVNAVILGGLGKDPATEDETDHANVADTPTTELSTKKKKTIQDLITEKLASRLDSDNHLESMLQGPSRLSQAVGYERPPLSAKTGITAISEVDMSTPQEKLEKVWSALKMPDALKLDMAIKYSSDEYIAILDQAIDAWQKATHQIVAREALMTDLERFERMASDPNRFFERGFRGSSVARLDEAKHRSILYRKIEAVTVDVKRTVKVLQNLYKDTITYQGRPYLDKMNWDRTEMLYWLSEERRKQALEHEARLRDVPLNIVQLAPLTTH